ncbi:MAG: tail fiber domain-containing protein [Ferruginibacter sp.]
MKRILSILVALMFISFSNNSVYAQNIGINADGSTPDANAMLDIKASNKGLLIPRTSTTSRIAIPNTKGLLVYDTTLASFWYNDGVAWQQISNGAALNGTVNYLPKFTGINTAGNSQIVDNGQFVGIGTKTPNAGLNIINNGGIIAKGDTLSANSYSLTETGKGAKFIWHPKKGALRAGFLDDDNSTEWDDQSIGNWSVGLGNDVLAQGISSFAQGDHVSSKGDYSFAAGSQSYATGKYSIAIGTGAHATGGLSVVLGQGNASGSESFAIGDLAHAIGNSSYAMGLSATANGNFSYALGYQVSAGENAFSTGYNSNASGLYSCAFNNNNTASGLSSFASGSGSTASGLESFTAGSGNTASGQNSFAIGDASNATGSGSIAMGEYVDANGYNAIGMGTNVTAGGDYSFVWGRNSNTTGTGSFVLGYNLFDGGHKGNAMLGDTDPWNAGSVGSGSDNQMICRFNNGYYFLTGGNTNRSGMIANHGDNSWSQISDSTKKEKLIPVNGEDLLKKISNFKLTTWNYKGQDPKVFRHYGPMAQDFHTAFGHDAIGTIGNDTLINQADFLGVSFTAIQALEKRTEKIEEQQKKIDNLQKENTALSATNEKLQQQLQTLLSAVAVLGKKVETLAMIENKNNSVAKK